jgi:rare lipoprotein A
MRPWLVLPLMPFLALALSHGADAASRTRTSHHHHQLASNQHTTRHHGARHLAYHRRGHATELTDSDGWNPIAAGVSAPVGATVQLASFETPMVGNGTSGGRVSLNDFPGRPSQVGVASYYGGYHQGRRTASGRIFNEHEMTAAHPYLPFGTKVLVQVRGSDRAVVVTITDRLFNRHRIIDLSEGAASQLGIIRAGTAMVMLTPQG